MKPKPGRPKTNELSRKEQVRRNVRAYRDRLYVKDWKTISVVVPDAAVFHLDDLAEERGCARQDLLLEIVVAGLGQEWEKEKPGRGKVIEKIVRSKLKRK